MRRRLATTLVCLPDGTTGARLDRLADAANVRVIRPDEGAPPLDRAVEMWRAAVGTHLPFTATDADPLGLVRAAWTHRFDVDSGGVAAPAGELEVAVNETLVRWRAGSLDLPDFYLLDDVDELTALDRHWYLGVLAAACSRRVVLGGRSLALSLRRLPTGPWWPPLDELVAHVDQILPEQVGLPAATPPASSHTAEDAGSLLR